MKTLLLFFLTCIIGSGAFLAATNMKWHIFPQIAGLGFSATSRLYAIQDKGQAEVYLKHPVLGIRLIEISKALMNLDDNHARRIFGNPDDMKLKSYMTLFGALPSADPVFGHVLAKFFNGIQDWVTLRLLDEGS